MRPAVHGIHHVTCIAGDAQENVDFYTRVMGMHLVKRTVNQDAPDTYHLFYADGVGTPGTDLTFFPWSNMGPGRPGIGLTMEVPFAVPPASIPYWQRRFAENKVLYGEIEHRFDELTLPFQDPHGLHLALVETASPRQFIAWQKSPVPLEFQVRGMHSVRLWERQLQPTQDLLTQSMGFTLVGEEHGWQRYVLEGGGSGAYIELKELLQERRGQWGVGSIHHVAWRVKDESEQMTLRQEIESAGLHPTPPIDRFWFKSVYYKEPGGALFELATEGPGFSRDEDPERLGERLILPPWLESRRTEIETLLPPLEIVQNPIGSQ